MSAICKQLCRIVPLAVCLALVLGSCGGRTASYRYTYLDVFDTVTGITVYAPSQAEADRLAELIHGELVTCHRLFDIYREYDGITNLCTVNRLAGTEAVVVDGRILDLSAAAGKKLGLDKVGHAEVVATVIE